MQSRSLHPTDAEHKGFGHSPTSILQRKKCFCIDENIACRCRRCIYVCPACGRYETSQHTFQNSKIILRSRPSIFKFHLMRAVIFLHKNFRVCNRSKQGELVPTHKFWIRFFKSDFKNACWALPKPDIQHKNVLVPHLNGRWISKFLGEKFVSEKSALIHPISHQTWPITSGFEGKKRK